MRDSLYQSFLERIFCAFSPSAGVTIDSRQVEPGAIFFGVPGTRSNGGCFAPQALAAGAALAVVDAQSGMTGERIVVVDSVTVTLQDLAREYRRRLEIPVIAITGTNGKTTTKELLRTALESQFRIAATEGNYNNHLGVPLTILSIPPEAEMALVEMGTNHPGEIRALCEIAQPNYGLITSLGVAHLEGFGSGDAIVEEKGELFRYLGKNNGLAFVREDDARIRELASRYLTKDRQSEFSLEEYCTADERGERVHTNAHGELYLHLSDAIISGETTLETHLAGSYNAINVVAALHVANFFGVELSRSLASMGEYRPENNRSQLLRTTSNTLIVDCYNANPTSMEAALRDFAQLLEERPRLAILGEMGELGNSCARCHQDILELLKLLRLEVMLVGESWSSVQVNGLKRWQLFQNIEELQLVLQFAPVTDRLILLKGSRSVGLERVIPLL